MRNVQRSPKAEVRIKRQNTAHYLFPTERDEREDVPKPPIPIKHKKDHNHIPPELKTFKYETSKESSKHWQTPKKTTKGPDQDVLVQSPKNPEVKVSNPETSDPRTNVQNLFDQTSSNWENPLGVNHVVSTRKAQGQIKPKTPNKKKKQGSGLIGKSPDCVSIGTPAFKVEVPKTPKQGEKTSTSQNSSGSVNIDANGVRFQMPKTPSKVIN